jgi:hypothetical protein
MCDDCNCEPRTNWKQRFDADCTASKCKYAGSEKEGGNCDDCDKKCDCDCHTDYTPDGIDTAKEAKYDIY